LKPPGSAGSAGGLLVIALIPERATLDRFRRRTIPIRARASMTGSRSASAKPLYSSASHLTSAIGPRRHGGALIAVGGGGLEGSNCDLYRSTERPSCPQNVCARSLSM